MSKTHLPRIPAILAAEISGAIRNAQVLEHTELMRLLLAYRDNRRKSIAVWGLTSIGAPVTDIIQIPIEHLDRIQRLDQAFQKLHQYNSGGASEYVATDVERVINRLRRLSQEGRKSNYSEIINFLKSRSYANSDNKKALEIAAAERFKVSRRTVERAAKEGGLTRPKRKSIAK